MLNRDSSFAVCIQIMYVDEDSEKNLDLKHHCIRQHWHLKEAFDDMP